MTMSKKLYLMLFFRLGLVVLACVVGCTPAVQVDLTGGWSGTYSYTTGPMTSLTSSFSMDLVDDDGRIRGSVTLPSYGMLTFDLPVTRGETHADTVVLDALGVNDQVTPPATVRFSLDGKVTATAMSGIGTHTVNGTSYAFTWQATLVAPPPAES